MQTLCIFIQERVLTRKYLKGLDLFGQHSKDPSRALDENSSSMEEKFLKILSLKKFTQKTYSRSVY